MKSNKGFTLIELLIVIAIIGILAAVLIPNLLGARNKSADAAIKANLIGTKAQALLFYDAGSTYTGVCATTGTNTIGAQVAAAAASGPDTSVTTNSAVVGTAIAGNTDSNCTVNAAGDAWYATVPLKTGGWVCVDSTGQTKISTATTGNSVAASAMVCS